MPSPTVKEFFEALSEVSPTTEIDLKSIRWDIHGNVHFESDEWGFSGDWWKK
jgi:hypothetical protein